MAGTRGRTRAAAGWSLLLVWVLAWPTAADDGTLVETATGAVFPARVAFTADGADYDLAATGLAVRKILFLNIYAIGHYLDVRVAATPEAARQQVLSDAHAKQATLVFARHLRAAQLRDGLRESYEKVASAGELAETEAVLQRFLAAIASDVDRQDRFTLRWLPGGRLQAVYDDEVALELRDATFARVLWSIWFGPNAVVDADRLLGTATALAGARVAGGAPATGM